MVNLATANVSNIGALSPKEKLRLLELQEMEIAIFEEEQRRQKEAELNQAEGNEIIIPEIVSSRKAMASAFPLRQFIYEAFPIVEKGREFKNNWHIDAIAELLQAVTVGDIENYIINVPRRTSKSTLVCVMWLCWEWTFQPQIRYLFTSYSQDFAKRDNEKCKDLIDSDYYQQRWGNVFQLKVRRRAKITNDAGGYRVVFRIGKGTGEGGDRVIGDDPNAIDEVESETILESTNRGWREVSYHNVIDRNNASRGLIQQRTAPNDVTGSILDDGDIAELYAHLCLSMEFEVDHPYNNSISKPLRLGNVSEFEKNDNPVLTVGEEKLWIDPRSLDAPFFENDWYKDWYKRNFTDKGLISKGEGQMLWESYITPESLLKEIAHLGAYGYASQYQQRPVRRGGNFFNSANFPQISLSEVPFDKGLSFCRYWDKAGTEGGGDWTVGLLLARTLKRPFEFFIIDLVRMQSSYYERMNKMIKTAKQDYADYVEKYDYNEYCVAIEREPSSSGKDLATIEKDALMGYDVFIDVVRKGKATRAKPVRNFSESGRIKVVKGLWNTLFFKRLEKFNPNKDNQVDEEIDTLSGAFRKLAFSPQGQGGSGGGTY